MTLRKSYIRDDRRQIVASVTDGFDEGHGSVVRKGTGEMVGRTTTRFNETRDSSGKIVSTNTAGPGLLVRKRR